MKIKILSLSLLISNCIFAQLVDSVKPKLPTEYQEPPLFLRGDGTKISFKELTTMKIKVKKLYPNAVIPKYAKEGDAGLDLVAISIARTDLYTEYGTGLSIEIPEGHVGLIFPRSSISNMDLTLANSVGVIDSGYRGEIKIRFKSIPINIETRETQKMFLYDIGDRVAQLIIIPIPHIQLVEAEELSTSERGDGGFGSTNYY